MGDSIYQLPHALAVLTPQWRDRVSKRSWGPILWKQLHDRPEETGGDLSREPEWIDGFTKAIPCDDCRAHFAEYVRHVPPDFANTRNYFMWGWWAHNSVRIRLGLPIFKWNLKSWGDPPCPVGPHALEE